MTSRNDRLWDQLIEVAKTGKWSYQTTLYPSEARRIERQWHVSIQILKKVDDTVSCLIAWSNAFPDGMDYKQSWYISKLQDEIPQVETPAQRLFLIAARA